jgi:hypothetical protein
MSATDHIASCLRIETVSGGNVSVRPLHRLHFSYFFPSSGEEIENAAQ